MFRRFITVAATVFAALLLATTPASAGGYFQTLGPSQSYITLDVNGSGTWVNGAVVGNYAIPGTSGSFQICRYQFQLTFRTATGENMTWYSPKMENCTLGHIPGAHHRFTVNRPLEHGSRICGNLWREGNFYRGPCATIRA